MEEGVRSGSTSGVVVKNRNSSGCLIVRRKGDGLVGGCGGLGSSSSRKVFESSKEKKRQRLVMSDSGSSDELLIPHRRRVGSETIRVCNDLTSFEKGTLEDNEMSRKRKNYERIWHNEDGMVVKNGLDDSERKRSKLDVFEFDEYDGVDGEMMHRKRFDDSGIDSGGRKLSRSMHVGRSSIEREFETGSSRHVVDNRKKSYFDRKSFLNRGDHIDKSRFEISREGSQSSLLRDKFIGHSDEPIRLQGKNGVLKVMVKKKKSVGRALQNYAFHKAEDSRKASRTEEIAKKNVVTAPFYPDAKLSEKAGSVVRAEKIHMNARKPLPTKKSKATNWDSEDSDTSLNPGSENVEACKSSKRTSCEGDDSPSCEKLQPNRIKEGKVKRGSGTEKQKLRERIRGMLLSAGWNIDYRPRRNRDYLDAVYINPSGTAYWSIIKAYDALQKQLNDEDIEAKPSTDPFTPIADDVLSQLTRKTRKKIEKEMKKKQRDSAENENSKRVGIKRCTSTKHDTDSMDSASHEEKLSSFIKPGGKPIKGKMNENGFASVNSNGENSTQHLSDAVDKSASGSNSHLLHGRKSRKLGRSTLLARSSNKGLNSEADGFVPYTGKRTLLSWLIDSGTVQLSQKVQYMNRRRTRVVLEGWITRDGIHCGCCSKILTISKFEIHAGSKLRQPYQNIYLDSGVSLLQCQIDAWNRQKDSGNIGFHAVDTDGDDPNDDTCGICGDGGDLICCDGCPSTFHQSCLGIQMPPPGDWHCPNCTCKFCGIASENVSEEDDATFYNLLDCSLCEKKYHVSCVQDMDASLVDSSAPSFCGQKCKELFEHLQKYLGVKHDLEAGFSWSLLHRTDEDSDVYHRGAPHRVESNSKLAVALSVMDECFLPIVDRRSGVNLIHNVLYNCGSNFNRLNYGGFYTVILERGDEIISAASIRFHGTKLAEMPFIGTRHIYRRQGMCRRLFCAIESVLCSLKVEKLIIPAISELMHTWTVVFSFTSLDEKLKQDLRSMNMLVFPGIDMLQKLLLEQETEANIKTNAKQIECKGKQYIEETDEVAIKSDTGTSAANDSNGCDDEADLDNVNETANNRDDEAADWDNINETANNPDDEAAELENVDEMDRDYGAADLDNFNETANNSDDEAADLDNANETANNLKDETTDLDTVNETDNMSADEAVDSDHINEMANNGYFASAYPGSGCGSEHDFFHGTVVKNGSFDASTELKNTDNGEGMTDSDSQLEAKCDGSGTPCERKNMSESPSSSNHDTPEMEDKSQDQPNITCDLTREISNEDLLIK